MSHKIRIGTKQLDSEELNRRFPGLSLNVPCPAKCVAVEDGGSAPTPLCHVFDNLSRWNYVLWHVGLQLRELRNPGRLSLVRVVYRGVGGRILQARSRQARILLHVLLVQHSCVESLHLDDALIEGSGLGEYRVCLVSSLRQNTSLRTLTLGSLFSEYRSIKGELFEVIATMTNLRELAVFGSAAAPSALLDAVCALLVHTTCLATLTIPRLAFDETSGTRLVAALRCNKTVQNLTQVRSVSVEGVDTDPASTFQDIKSIVVPFRIRGNLQKLRLTGFRLSAQCACLFAALVSGKEGSLKSLDIAGCRWRQKSRLEQSGDVGAADDEQSGEPHLDHQSCAWIQALGPTTRMQLSFLALNIQALDLEDLRQLLNTALTVESLKTVSLSGVPLEKLKAVCRVIRETAMSGRVRIEDAYLVDSRAIVDLREFPEALSKVAIRSFIERSPKQFETVVRLAWSWFRVTLLSLHLAQGILSDVPSFRALCTGLSAADSLRVLSLTGCDEPDLSRTLRSAGRPHSVLLEMIFKNTAIRALRLNGLRMGEENLRFFVAGIVANRSLCELAFASCVQAENDTFLRLLAPKFRQNKTISHLRLLASRDCQGDEWFAIENVIGRNVGRLTCAAHYVVDMDYSPRCDAALAVVSGTNALMKRVEQLIKDGGSTGNFPSTSAA
ncbi:hypothetical protein MTO96_017636 [Rhipicephalus appendiculatus]